MFVRLDGRIAIDRYPKCIAGLSGGNDLISQTLRDIVVVGCRSRAVQGGDVEGDISALGRCRKTNRESRRGSTAVSLGNRHIRDRQVRWSTRSAAVRGRGGVTRERSGD